MTQEKQAEADSGPLAYLTAALPGGAIEQAQQLAAKAKLYDPAAARQTGEDAWKYMLGGLGIGLTGTKLYHVISDMNRQKPKYTKFGPGSKTVDEAEKIAAIADIYNQVVSMPGKVIQNITEDQTTRDALAQAATIGGFATSAYGGSKLMSAIIAKKRKEDLQSQVDDAKKEYLRALTSRKHAAALDTAFESYKKLPAEKRAFKELLNTILWPIKATKAIPGGGADIYKAYVLTTLGSGALAGKMTYDWTRARSRDKAIADAQKTRARMAGTSPIHVDPEQMAALKQVAANS
jgi:hypothetical protein